MSSPEKEQHPILRQGCMVPPPPPSMSPSNTCAPNRVNRTLMKNAARDTAAAANICDDKSQEEKPSSKSSLDESSHLGIPLSTTKHPKVQSKHASCRPTTTPKPQSQWNPKLYGRQVEEQQLLAAYHRCIDLPVAPFKSDNSENFQRRAELILITGASGTGKVRNRILY
jgi:hypothetical protein